MFLRAQGGLHQLEFNKNRTQLSGYISNFSGGVDPNFKMYFILNFSQPVINDDFDLSDEDQILLLRFTTTDKLEVSLATSFINAELILSKLN